MSENRLARIVPGAFVIVAIVLLVLAAGPKVGAVSEERLSGGIGAPLLLDNSQEAMAAEAASAPVSQQALDAWAARYAGQAAELNAESGNTQQALDAWAARYAGQAAELNADPGIDGWALRSVNAFNQPVGAAQAAPLNADAQQVQYEWDEALKDAYHLNY